MRPRFYFLALVGLLTFKTAVTPSFIQAQGVPSTEAVQGLRDRTPATHALRGARIFVTPDRVLENGVLIVRDGLVESVGENLPIPPDAQVWELSGKSIYPGFIDAYAEVEVEGTTSGGAAYWNSLITPQNRLANRYRTDRAVNEKLRSQGITTRLVVPAQGIFRGTSALVTTGEDSASRTMLKAEVAQHVRLTTPRNRNSYPGSPMGAVALARQACYDAEWYGQAWTAYRGDRSLPRPEQNEALEVLQAQLAGGGLMIIDTTNEWHFLRAHAFAREFSVPLVIRGSGREYRRLDAVRESGRAVIVPLNFPKPPNVASAETALNTSLESLLHWDLAPENPARLEAAQVKLALTTHGLSEINTFLGQLRKAVQRGWPPAAALRALTATPAELLGMTDRLGSLEPGKLAHFTVTSGDLFDSKSQVLETWVDGRRYEVTPQPGFDLRGKWRLTTPEQPSRTWLVNLSGKLAQVQGTLQPDEAAPGTEPIKLEHLGIREGRFSATFKAKSLVNQEGIAQLTGIVTLPEGQEPTWSGDIVWPDGSRWHVTAVRTTTGSAESEPADEGQKPDAEKPDAEKPDAEKPDAEKPKSAGASFGINYPLGAFGREAPPEQPAHVVFANATVWTCGPQGKLEGASVLVGAGKILAVGKDIPVPEGAVLIDCQGRHLSPGIIDCHSHMATDGGVNEGTQAVTAEVRIGDFIDANDIDIYRQLAGGVTTANVLHGSANPIGGQNQVIKLRWGSLPEEMKFAGAPPGIKFALGENVKQSNWTNPTGRYPQSRMGVEQIMGDAFQAAQEYDQRWQQWHRVRRGIPPRKDLELDALAEVLRRERWIHCHSYRQDEILAFLRLLESFDIQVGTLQHILEGYKVADAMAQHGAMGSSFSDWWAYKMEVWDAIPFNGALMHRAGVVVSFNSDDRELARHLNHEAAKAVKYGGVPPEEALKFVTLNPARQLRIDSRVGSLEPGKDADLVVWSASPLSVMSRCEETWIDGRRYFSRDEDQALREEVARRRAVLVQKVLASGESMKKAEDAPEGADDLWARDDEFCHPHGRSGKSEE